MGGGKEEGRELKGRRCGGKPKEGGLKVRGEGMFLLTSTFYILIDSIASSSCNQSTR